MVWNAQGLPQAIVRRLLLRDAPTRMPGARECGRTPAQHSTYLLDVLRMEVVAGWGVPPAAFGLDLDATLQPTWRMPRRSTGGAEDLPREARTRGRASVGPQRTPGEEDEDDRELVRSAA